MVLVQTADSGIHRDSLLPNLVKMTSVLWIFFFCYTLTPLGFGEIKKLPAAAAIVPPIIDVLF